MVPISREFFYDTPFLAVSSQAQLVDVLEASAEISPQRRDRERLSKVSNIPGHRRRRALYPPRRGRYAKGEMQRRNFVGLFQPVLVVESLPSLPPSLPLSLSLSLSRLLVPPPFPITLAKALLLSFYLAASLSGSSHPLFSSISLVRSALWAN